MIIVFFIGASRVNRTPLFYATGRRMSKTGSDDRGRERIDNQEYRGYTAGNG